MTATAAIAELLIAQAMNPVTLMLVIVAATFVLEDAATLAVGAAAAQGAVPVELALAGLVFGTIAGDFALHLIGRSAAGTRYGRRLRADRRVLAAENWLKRRELTALAIARIVPGLRLPTYAASGFLRLSPVRTLLVLTAVTLLWTPALFLLGHGAGMAGLALGPAGWAALAVLLAGALAAPRLARRRT